MQQEVLLAMLARGPSQGYQLRAMLDGALGPLGEAMNDGQIYVALGRLERAGLVARQGASGSSGGDGNALELVPAGQHRADGEAASRQGLRLISRPMDRPEPKVYALTPAGKERVTQWLAEVSWPKPDLAEFHLKLVSSALSGLADPIRIVHAQRTELLRRLRDAERAAMAEPNQSAAGLLLEGIVLRLQADLRWLEACERAWASHGSQR